MGFACHVLRVSGSIHKAHCCPYGDEGNTQVFLDFAKSVLVNRALFEISDMTEATAVVFDEGNGVAPFLQSRFRRMLGRKIKILLQIVFHFNWLAAAPPAGGAQISKREIEDETNIRLMAYD